MYAARSSTVYLHRVLFSFNDAGPWGSAVFVDDNVTLLASATIFDSNVADRSALFVSSIRRSYIRLTQGVDFVRNMARLYVGAFRCDGSGVLAEVSDGVRIVDNFSPLYGGGMMAWGGSHIVARGDVVIRNNLVNDVGHSGCGGLALMFGSVGELYDGVVVKDNIGIHYGAGVCNQIDSLLVASGNVKIENNDLLGDLAGASGAFGGGGGILHSDSSSAYLSNGVSISHNTAALGAGFGDRGDRPLDGVIHMANISVETRKVSTLVHLFYFSICLSIYVHMSISRSLIDRSLYLYTCQRHEYLSTKD